MTDGRSRFCVLFTGVGDNLPVKTRLLHSDSNIEDLKQIWKTLYEEDPPTGAQIIINENCIYRLDDVDDLKAFFAQAEDQYKILPSNPLKVFLGFSKNHIQNNENSFISSNVNQYKETDLTAGKTCNENNNNSCHSPEHVKTGAKLIKTEPRKSEIDNLTSNTKFFESFCNNIPNPSLSNVLTPVSDALISLSKIPKPISSPASNGHNIENSIERMSSENTFPLRLNQLKQSPQHFTLNDNHNERRNNHLQPLMGYTKQIAESSASSYFNAHNKVTQSNLPTNTQFDMPSYSALMNRLQENRAMQTNPSASFILQTILNNQMRSIAAARELNSQNCPLPPTLSNFGDQRNDIAKSLMQNSMSFGSTTPLPTPLSTATTLTDISRNASIFSSLAYGGGNNILNYMPNNRSMNEPENKIKKDIQPPPKKRRRAKNTTLDGKPSDTVKRMRSSTSHSNIEYHYERALDYSVMKPEEQKLQNSAHRSHWKHLLFVVKTSPTFLQTFKHAKYDEWSSEARDIFAISQPDKYMWSFLTLSKQGDLLCTRILGRIGNLIKLKIEERPEWCPPDETLERAQTKAQERLSQLQRILYSRAINNDTNKKTPSNNNHKSKTAKYPSLHDQSLALMTAYHQRQKEFLQNQVTRDTAHLPFPPYTPTKTPPRKQNNAIQQHSTYNSSSVSSSPVSNISPTIEHQFTQESSHGEQTDSPPSTPGEIRRGASDNDGCLVIDTQRKSSSEKSPISNRSSTDSDTKHDEIASPQRVNPVSMITSPHRWSIAT